MSEIKTAAKHVVISGGRLSDGGSIPPASTKTSSNQYQKGTITTGFQSNFSDIVSGMVPCRPTTVCPQYWGQLWGQLVDLESELPPHAANRHRYSLRKTSGTKPFKLFDGGGLHLEVNPAGGKWWRWKYRFAGKAKRLSFGVYPDVSLKAARDKRDDAR